MSLLRVQVDPGQQLGRAFTDLETKNLPFAMVQAANATAWEIRSTWQAEALKVFDRPTAMTRNAVQFDRATKTRPEAVIRLRDEAHRGTPPAKYLLPQVEGGQRRRKGFENLLMQKGAMPAGTYAVPGKGATLDASGNVRPGQINQILSQLGARHDRYQSETATSRKRRHTRDAKAGRNQTDYIVLLNKRYRMLPGIYERIVSSWGIAVRSIFIFVRRAQYRPRYDIFGMAQKTWTRIMPFHFNRELQKAVETSKFRGRG